MVIQDELKKLLDYNPKTGIFIWLVLGGKQKNLGYFLDKKIAYEAYVQASKQFGEFQRIC